MLPMTPAQSWAFLILIVVTVLLLAWLVDQAGTALGPKRAARSAESELETAEPEPVRPVLHLVEDLPRSHRGPAEVYDWSRHGL